MIVDFYFSDSLDYYKINKNIKYICPSTRNRLCFFFCKYNVVLYNVLGLTKGKRDDKLGIRAASSCNIILDNVIVPTENMLGNEGDGFKIAMSGIG